MNWIEIDGELHDENKGCRFSVYLDKDDLKNINRISNYFKYDKSRVVRLAIRSVVHQLKKNDIKI